jgi:D-serine deaminase-like pyridoxal phosphate-dependent protein
MTTRRTFVLAAAAAPAVLRAAGERRPSWSEIEKILASGDVKGKLSRDDLPTPALLLDMDGFEFNVRKMTEHARASGRALRPHGKTHKCPEIAKRLIKAGAVGACGAKLSEAEVFAAHGVTGLLVTTAVVGKHKIERAVRLARKQPGIMYSFDDLQNARDLNEAAKAANVKLNLAVDLLVGMRTGITPGEPAARLVEQLEGLTNVRFAGIQAYAGQASHVTGFEARKKRSREIMAAAVETRHMIEKKGIECKLLTGGSTGTYNIDTEIDGITEIQPGSFIFMDIDYNRIGGQSGDFYDDFKNSLTVLTSVVSKPDDRTAIVDGGFKAFSTDRSFPPLAKKLDGVKYGFAGDEHGKLTAEASHLALKLGDRPEFIVPHCDPSVNLYDRLYCLRGDSVEAVWPIAARGMAQ